jgi:copper resistance protein B
MRRLRWVVALASLAGCQQLPAVQAQASESPPGVVVDSTSSSSGYNMPAMSYSQMAQLMGMDDTDRIGRLLVDQLEYRGGGADRQAAWDAQARYGNDVDKVVLRSEGEWESGSAAQGRADLLWDRIISRWWSLQAGARYDFGLGPGRGWAALGVAGLAPYWIDTEATAYIGESGALAARVKMETDLLLTQRWIVQPEVELNAYSRSDPARAQGAGISDMSTGLRLRYDIRRGVAPYAGIDWDRHFGASAQLLRNENLTPNALQWTLGLRMMF